MIKLVPRNQTSSLRGMSMTQLVESVSQPIFEEQRVSPVTLLAIWLFLGLVTYGFAMFKIWAPLISPSFLIAA